MGHSLRALVVEDSQDDALLLKHRLLQAGYDIVDFARVETPEEMAAALDKGGWDIIIADYSLPQFSAPTALSMVKSRNLDVPFVIVSGAIGEETAVEAMRAGAHDYIMKGNLARLIPAIERELREAESRRQRRQAENDLNESQRAMATLMSNLPGMAYRCKNDRDWTMLFVSDGCYDLTGFYPSDLVNSKLVSYGKIILPNDMDMVWGTVQDAISEMRPYQQTYRIATKSGDERWVWEKGRGVFSKEGELLALEGFLTDITDRKRNEEQIENSLKEKDVLLREIHHRVKNNLQIISSLLNLQSRQLSDEHALAVFKESQDRIRAMTLIHEKLYQSKDLGKVNLAEYIRSLCDYLVRSYLGTSHTVTVTRDVESVTMGLDTAIPCGMIINELVSNSLKYAFPNGGVGEIHIGLHRNESGQLELSVSDNGDGFPPDLDFRSTETLGLQLVTTLTDQLEGTVELHRDGGTQFKIQFNAVG